MELSKTLISIIEKHSLPEDLKQDLYVQLLETDDVEFEEPEDVFRFVNAYLHNLRKNSAKVEANRERLRVENEETIRENIHPGAYADDPLDELIAVEEFDNKLDALSPLLRRTAEDLLLEGMTPEQLAESEGTTANVVYQRIFRIKEALGEK